MNVVSYLLNSNLPVVLISIALAVLLYVFNRFILPKIQDSPIIKEVREILTSVVSNEKIITVAKKIVNLFRNSDGDLQQKISDLLLSEKEEGVTEGEVIAVVKRIIELIDSLTTE